MMHSASDHLVWIYETSSLNCRYLNDDGGALPLPADYSPEATTKPAKEAAKADIARPSKKARRPVAPSASSRAASTGTRGPPTERMHAMFCSSVQHIIYDTSPELCLGCHGCRLSRHSLCFFVGSGVRPTASLLETPASGSHPLFHPVLCEPLSWESASHPTYKGEEKLIVARAQRRYKFWAPKVVWIIK